MAEPMPDQREGALVPLLTIARHLGVEIDHLRTMHLEPGDAEPVDNTGMDLCGRVRELAHLCHQLQQELSAIAKRIEKGPHAD